MITSNCNSHWWIYMIVHNLDLLMYTYIRGISSSLASALCPKCSTDQSAINPQFSQDKFHLPNGNNMYALVHCLHNRCEQQITCTTHSAPKDDSLWADDPQNVSHRDP